MPLLLLVGAGVDYRHATQMRTAMRNALDSATLAGAAHPQAAERVNVAEKAFAAGMINHGVTNVTPTFTQNADGTFSGKASGSVATSFMKIANIQSIAIATAARAKPIAAPAPSSIAFTALSAKGWFWKSVTLWIHRPGDATDTALATFTYQPTNLFNEGTGKTDGPFGAQIPLGTNYDKLYLTMTVRDNGCGPGYKPRHPGAMQGSTYYWDPYECVAGQSTPAVVPYTFSTNDPATSDHLFVNGVRLATGVSVSFDKLAKCNESVIHSWEDTKVYKAGDQAWATQDFVFKVAVSSCAANSAASASSGARLIE